MDRRRSQRVGVAGGPGLTAREAGLLGGKVAGGAEHVASLGQAVPVEQPGQAEVGGLGGAVVSQE